MRGYVGGLAVLAAVFVAALLVGSSSKPATDSTTVSLTRATVAGDPSRVPALKAAVGAPSLGPAPAKTSKKQAVAATSTTSASPSTVASSSTPATQSAPVTSSPAPTTSSKPSGSSGGGSKGGGEVVTGGSGG